MALELFYGGPVSGNQKFDRPDLEDRFITQFKGGVGIKMFGLRRIGKSTMRRHLHDLLVSEDRQVAYIDGQGLSSLSAFLKALSIKTGQDDGLWSRALSILAAGPAKDALKILGKGEQLEAATLSAYWQHVSEAIKTALKAGSRPVLIVDEFSYLIQNMVDGNKAPDGNNSAADVDQLLGAMREWREAGMQMLLTGSIGITQLARRKGLNLEHLNDLQPFYIPELTEDEAREFIANATAGSEGHWTNAHTDAFLLECNVLYPCFLVKGLQEVGTKKPVAPEQFARVFEETVRPYLHNDFFEQFNKRFKMYEALEQNERQGLILPALKAIMTSDDAIDQKAIPANEPFTRVDLEVSLSMLVEDGFIHFREDRNGNRYWKPGSNLARIWWNRANLA